ncbi:hypothetical protein [Paenibacillus eucommiae]
MNDQKLNVTKDKFDWRRE